MTWQDVGAAIGAQVDSDLDTLDVELRGDMEALEARIAALEGSEPPPPGDTSPPQLSQVAVSDITTMSARVSWWLDEPCTGQVEYGSTTAYGSLTVKETSFDYEAHSQVLSGLSPGTTYHFRVISIDEAGNATIGPDATFETQAAAPPPAPTVYGPGVVAESKANINLVWDTYNGSPTDNSVRALSHSFIASRASLITALVTIFRFGSGYSYGTGGTVELSIQGDANGVPNGTKLATKTYVPGNSGNTGIVTRIPWATGFTPIAGTRYHIVYKNIDANATANRPSINQIIQWQGAAQVGVPDLKVLGLSQHGWTHFAQYTPCFDLEYADGGHDGNAYIEAMVAQARPISGSNRVQDDFTVLASRTISSIYARPEGSGTLSIELRDASRTVLRSGVASGSPWRGISFSPIALVAGQRYFVELSAPSGSLSMVPIRSEDFSGTTLASRAFREGKGRYSTNGGSSWSDLYGSSHQNIQWYAS